MWRQIAKMILKARWEKLNYIWNVNGGDNEKKALGLWILTLVSQMSLHFFSCSVICSSEFQNAASIPCKRHLLRQFTKLALEIANSKRESLVTKQQGCSECHVTPTSNTNTTIFYGSISCFIKEVRLSLKILRALLKKKYKFSKNNVLSVYYHLI